MRVFVTHNDEDLEAYYGRALPELRGLADVVTNPIGRDLTTAELIEAANGCDVVVAHRATPGEAALFDGVPTLLAFLRTAVDISTVDVDAASRSGVLVAHADKSFIASTAELALGLALDLARHVADSTHDYRTGIEPPQRTGRQLAGAKAGVIGFGSIGQYLVNLLRAFDMDVVVSDPHVDVAGGAAAVSMPELLAASDVVFVAAASTPDTQNLIGARELATMRPDALLINVSRGELIDEAALVAALDAGRLAGFGCDVGMAPDQRPSPVVASHPLVVATPHLGGLTAANADAQAASSVEQVAAMLRGELPPRTVNPESATRFTDWLAP